MAMARKLITLTVLAAALGPSTARAQVTPANDARAVSLEGVALGYWQAAGVTACPQGIQFLYDASLTLLGAGWACVATLRTGYVNTLRDGGDRWQRRWEMMLECHAWTHEAGHALGLMHEDAATHPVMAPYAFAVPAACRQWAWRAYPRKVRTSRSSRPACGAGRSHRRASSCA